MERAGVLLHPLLFASVFHLKRENIMSVNSATHNPAVFIPPTSKNPSIVENISKIMAAFSPIQLNSNPKTVGDKILAFLQQIGREPLKELASSLLFCDCLMKSTLLNHCDCDRSPTGKNVYYLQYMILYQLGRLEASRSDNIDSIDPVFLMEKYSDTLAFLDQLAFCRLSGEDEKLPDDQAFWQDAIHMEIVTEKAPHDFTQPVLQQYFAACYLAKIIASQTDGELITDRWEKNETPALFYHKTNENQSFTLAWSFVQELLTAQEWQKFLTPPITVLESLTHAASAIKAQGNVEILETNDLSFCIHLRPKLRSAGCGIMKLMTYVESYFQLLESYLQQERIHYTIQDQSSDLPAFALSFDKVKDKRQVIKLFHQMHP